MFPPTERQVECYRWLQCDAQRLKLMEPSTDWQETWTVRSWKPKGRTVKKYKEQRALRLQGKDPQIKLSRMRTQKKCCCSRPLRAAWTASALHGQKVTASGLSRIRPHFQQMWKAGVDCIHLSVKGFFSVLWCLPLHLPKCPLVDMSDRIQADGAPGGFLCLLLCRARTTLHDHLYKYG